jgi:hypothetical protein
MHDADKMQKIADADRALTRAMNYMNNAIDAGANLQSARVWYEEARKMIHQAAAKLHNVLHSE